MTRAVLQILIMVFISAPTIIGEVVRLEIESRVDLARGKSFGSTGPYEKISGTVYFAIDPKNSANRIITDIDFAPQNADGLVEFHSDFFLIKPKSIERGNGTILYEVSNRGGKAMLSYFNRSPRSLNPETEVDMGDGFLMNNGFTLLWLGWQFDVPLRNELMRNYPPVATDGNKTILGLVRSEVIVTNKVPDASLADRNHIAYKVSDPTSEVNVMTVRDSVDGQRQMIPRNQWRFARVENGQIVADRSRVSLDGGFKPHKIYEIVYQSQDPPLVGLGPTAVRDMISKLKHGTTEDFSISAGTIDRALAFGISQSGRFLRTFLYYGFNEDEGHRRVFDGIISHVAGGGRGSFNHRFAQPSRDGHPFMNKFYPTDIFPFTDVVQSDPETDMRDGLLARVGPEFMPKIFYTNSSYEYWGRAASLIHTTLDGKEDIALLDNVRIYTFAGSQHGPGRFPPVQTIGQQLSNPNDYSWSMRSLVLAMNRWATEEILPPSSSYPRISEGELVLPGDLTFPQLPNVGLPSEPHKAYRVIYGPEYATKGIITIEPPEILSEFPVMVPQVDSDGNDVGGIKMPEVAVPLSTYTGWNLFRKNAGPKSVLSSMQGSYIPFPRSVSDQEQSGDPRASITERYHDRKRYLALVSKVGTTLVENGYLLPDDLPLILRRAGEHWDYLMTEDKPH